MVKYNANRKEYFQDAAKEILKKAEDLDEDKKQFMKEFLSPYVEYAPKNEKYTQDWSSYNEAQQSEKIMLMYLLDELLNYIEFPETKNIGRAPIPLRDKIFYTVMQSYNEKSSRRCISDLEIAKKYTFVQKAPHFNTVLNCLRDPTVTQYLKHLVNVSGIPLQQIENDFAVDASGFSTSEFGRWLNVRAGTDSEKRKFLKCHITCGVRSNIITAVSITKGYRADSPQFKELVEFTNRVYSVREVSADKAYSSKKNLEVVSGLGAIPFIPFKCNATTSSGSRVWRQMYLYFIKNPAEFGAHYHKRSNVESCFHMIKKKFGSHLRSRTYEGQVNEILAKCLCHNLCVLIQEAYEIGIDLDFKKCANYQIAHK